ncbi:MAG: helix-turn-helix domain-containing protein [Bacteroidetes bacterium]|nr:helix-turn-helix domain-containing protein [Bacteroidota bacterium]
MLNTKTIGNRITEARKRKNLSQAQLGEQLFISSQAVGKWERGESMPDIITLNRLAEILEVDLNYFSGGNHSLELSGTITMNTEQETLDKSPDHKAPQWNMSQGNWVGADFSGLKNLNEKFSSSNMEKCKFNNSELNGLNLRYNNVNQCDFSGSDLSNSAIQASNLEQNIFENAVIQKAEFLKCNIDKCDFSDVDFSETQFTKSFMYGCNITRANFSGVIIKMGGFTGIKSKDPEQNTIVGAIWNRTSFIESQIADLVFTGLLSDCYFEHCEFTRVVFKNVEFKNTFFKNNSNMKRIKFIDCVADRITYEFLKQGKADLNGIELKES